MKYGWAPCQPDLFTTNRYIAAVHGYINFV